MVGYSRRYSKQQKPSDTYTYGTAAEAFGLCAREVGGDVIFAAAVVESPILACGRAFAVSVQFAIEPTRRAMINVVLPLEVPM